MRLAAFASFAVFALAGCAGLSRNPSPVAVSSSSNASSAAVLADALAAADRADGAGDDAGLGRAMATINARDARPLDPSGTAQLARWQSRSPYTPPPLRGRTLGPGFRKGTLAAGSEFVIEQTFLSGQKASVALSTPDGARLGLQVIDSAAKPVCQSAAKTPACEWIPIFTQRHVIRLTNPGRREVRFYLVIE